MNYAGEQVAIRHTAEASDGVALTPSDVNDVKISVLQGNSVILSEVTMPWILAGAYWLYAWDTLGIAPGTYRAKVRIIGLDDKSIWEYLYIRLAPNTDP